MHKNDECLREILKENKIVFTEECEDEISASRFYATIYDAKCTIYNVANMTWMVGEVKLGKNKDKSVLYKELNELNCSNPFFIFYYDCEKEVLVTQLQIFQIENNYESIMRNMVSQMMSACLNVTIRAENLEDNYDTEFDGEKKVKQHIQEDAQNRNCNEQCEQNADDQSDYVLSEEDLRVVAEVFKVDKQEDKDSKMQDDFDGIYDSLKDNGGARMVSGIDREEEATAFLLDMCKTMPHAPNISSLANLSAIFADNVGEYPALVYGFTYSPFSMCQNVFIFLVNMEKNIRFFAIETDLFCGFCLCEYADGVHKNYGEVELKNIPTRIKEIIGA